MANTAHQMLLEAKLKKQKKVVVDGPEQSIKPKLSRTKKAK